MTDTYDKKLWEAIEKACQGDEFQLDLVLAEKNRHEEKMRLIEIEEDKKRKRRYKWQDFKNNVVPPLIGFTITLAIMSGFIWFIFYLDNRESIERNQKTEYWISSCQKAGGEYVDPVGSSNEFCLFPNKATIPFYK